MDLDKKGRNGLNVPSRKGHLPTCSPEHEPALHFSRERNMTALPPPTEVEHLLIDDPTSTPLNTYCTLILPAEKAALSEDDKANLIHARIAGYLLLYPPSQAARRILTLEIASCEKTNWDEQHEAVFELGAMYLRHFICLC